MMEDMKDAQMRDCSASKEAQSYRGGSMCEELKCTEHPHYGELIYNAQGLLVCHICGRAFKKLGAHIWNSHHILTRTYCEMYGLDLGKGLCSEEHRELLRENVMKHYDEVVGKNLIQGGVETRFCPGSEGRPKEKVSEQTRRRLVAHGSEYIKKNGRRKSKK